MYFDFIIQTIAFYFIMITSLSIGDYLFSKLMKKYPKIFVYRLLNSVLFFAIGFMVVNEIYL